MSGIGDLVAHLSIDNAEFVDGVQEAASASQDSGERVIRIIEEQHGSWLNFSAAVIGATGRIVGAFGHVASGAMNLAAAHVEAAHNDPWGTLAETAWKYGGVISKVVGIVVPQWKLITVAIGTGILAYKLATSETMINAAKTVGSNAQVNASFRNLQTSTSGLSAALTRPFEDVASVGTAVVEILNPIPMILNRFGPSIASGFDAASSAINRVTENVTKATDGFIGLALAAASGNLDNAAKFTAEAAALRELATETERVIALQQKQQISFRQLGAMQNDAAQAASRAQQLTEVSHLTNLEDIEKEIQATQQRASAEILAGTQTQASMAQTKAMFDALHKQKEGVESGRITEDTVKEKSNPVADMIAQANAQLNVLKLGETEAQVAAAVAKGANEEQAESLRKLLNEKLEIKAATKAQEDAERELAAAQQHTASLQKQGAERIASLKDEIDKQTGAATTAEIEMRKLARAGYSQDQIEMIGTLTESLETLKKKQEKEKTDKPEKEREGHSAASLAGSQDAAKIFLRGFGGPNKDDVPKKSLDIQTKMLEATQLIATTLQHANTPAVGSIS